MALLRKILDTDLIEECICATHLYGLFNCFGFGVFGACVVENAEARPIVRLGIGQVVVVKCVFLLKFPLQS